MRVHPKTLTRLNNGTLTRYRLGRRVLVDLDELDAVLAVAAGGIKAYKMDGRANAGL